MLAQRYAPEQSQADHQREIDRFFSNLCIAELTVQHLTGKEAIELVPYLSFFARELNFNAYDLIQYFDK